MNQDTDTQLPAPSNEPESGDTVATLAALGRALGRSRRQLVRDRHAGLPGGEGCYSVSAARAWLAAREADGGSKGENAKLRRDLLSADLEFRKARGELQRIEVRLRRGELIELADVDRERCARVLEVKGALEGLGTRIVPALQGLSIEEQVDLVDEYVRSILERFARSGTTRKRVKRGPGRPRNAPRRVLKERDAEP